MRPHRQQATKLLRPWDSPGKNTGVGCHFLLQCMHARILSHCNRVRLCATLWTVAHQAPPSTEYWSGLPVPSPSWHYGTSKFWEFRSKRHPLYWVKLAQLDRTFQIKSTLKNKKLNVLSLYQSFKLYSVQSSSVIQSCSTLCDPMDCSTPGLPVHHPLPESTQTHVHWVGDAIQPSHPLLSPSPPAFNLSQHQGLFQWVSSSHQVAKALEFQLQHQSFQWIFRTDFF